MRQSASPRSGLSISAHPGESAPILQPAPTVGADALGGPCRTHQTPRRSSANPHCLTNLSSRACRGILAARQKRTFSPRPTALPRSFDSALPRSAQDDKNLHRPPLCHCEPSRTTVRQSASLRSNLSSFASPGESAPILQPAPTVGADALGGPCRTHQTPRRSSANPHCLTNLSSRACRGILAARQKRTFSPRPTALPRSFDSALPRSAQDDKNLHRPPLCHCEPSRTTVRQSASLRSGLSISAHSGESAPLQSLPLEGKGDRVSGG